MKCITKAPPKQNIHLKNIVLDKCFNLAVSLTDYN